MRWFDLLFKNTDYSCFNAATFEWGLQCPLSWMNFTCSAFMWVGKKNPGLLGFMEEYCNSEMTWRKWIVHIVLNSCSCIVFNLCHILFQITWCPFSTPSIFAVAVSSQVKGGKQETLCAQIHGPTEPISLTVALEIDSVRTIILEEAVKQDFYRCLNFQVWLRLCTHRQCFLFHFSGERVWVDHIFSWLNVSGQSIFSLLITQPSLKIIARILELLCT